MVDVLAGTQVPLDAANIADMAAKNNLTARGQDIASADAAAARQQQERDAQRTYAAQIQQINQAYWNDAQTLGISQATLNYNQRVAAAQQGLAAVSEGSRERATAATTKLAALTELANRSGPQDWVRYNNLLNGLVGPRGTSTTIDPTAFADSIVDPQFRNGSNIDVTALDNAINQPYSGAGTVTAPQLAVPGITTATPSAVTPPAWSYTAPPAGAATPTQTQAPAPTQTQTPPATTASQVNPNGSGTGTETNPHIVQNTSSSAVPGGTAPGDTPYSGVPNAQVAGLTKGQWQLVTTGTAGPSQVGDYNGFGVYDSSRNVMANPTQSIAGGTPLWLEKLSKGTKHGMIRDLMAIVGEGKGQKPGTNPAQRTLGNTGEVVVNPTGAPMGVLNNDQAKQMLRTAHATGTGMTMPGYRAGSGMQFGHPSHARATGGMRATGITAGVKQPRIGRRQPGLITAGGPGDPNAPQLQPQQPQQVQQAPPDPLSSGMPALGTGVAPITAADISRMMGQFSKGTGMPVDDAEDVAEMRAGHRPSAAEETEEDKRTKRAKVGFAILGRELHRYVDGTGIVPTPATDQPGSTTYGINPNSQTFTQYAPADTGSQPFYRKLIGTMPSQQFGGFGATLSNPSLGITNAPWAINMQNYLGLTPSEQDQTQSLYQQGLGTDFRDQLAESKRAAPIGATFGVTRYGS